MSTYRLPPRAASLSSSDTHSASPRVITGQWLARAHLNRSERAKHAADLVDGLAEIFPLTVRQSAQLMQVPVLDVSRARQANGNANGNGNGNGKTDGETLAQHLARSSPAELQEAARVMGIDAVWDRMISPIIATQTAE